MLKKILTSLLVFTMLFSSSAGIFTGLVSAEELPDTPISASSEPIALDEETTTAPDDIIIPPNALEDITTPPTIPEDVITEDSAPLADAAIEKPAMTLDCTDVNDPVFTEDKIDMYMPEGNSIADYYLYYYSYYVYAEDDVDTSVEYEIIYPEGWTYNDDGDVPPGEYTVEVSAFDNCGNVTGDEDSTSEDLESPNLIINVNVLSNPNIYASQIDYTTDVLLEFDYDPTLYPEGYVLEVLVVNENATDEEDEFIIDEFEIEHGTTELVYDQGNYEDYSYVLLIGLGGEDALFDIEQLVMIQLPEINSFSANLRDDGKTIDINYDVDLNDFTAGALYLEVNGERYMDLDPNKNSVTYIAEDPGTYEFTVVLDYSESADPLTKSTTVKVEPVVLSYTGYTSTLFESMILNLQDFVIGLID